MGEYSRRYEQTVVPELLKQSFAVVSYDQFGHGLSEGKKGDHPGYDCILDGLDQVLDKAQNLFQSLPTFLYGHSMGGNVVLNYALRRTSKIKGVVATSPFLKLAFQPPKIKLSVGKLLQKIAPSITMGNELHPNDISRDEIEVQKYIDDPLVHNKISPNFSITFIETGKWAIDNAKNLTTPTAIFHGTDDKIIDYNGSVEFADKTDKATIKLYEGGYHELHNDLCKEELITDIISWINNS